MGEVSVEIILTNPADQAMVREGYKKSDEIRTMKVKALVDTGSVSCVLTPFVADRLGLARVFRHIWPSMRTAAERKRMSQSR